MGAMVPGDDEQPATRRDLSNEREVTAANARAGFAELRTDMVDGFRETDQKISAVSAKVDGLRTDMVEGFRNTDKKIAAVRTDMVEGFRNTDKEIAAVRENMQKGFRETDQAIAAVSEKVDRRMTTQARFMTGLLVTMCATLLAELLGNG